MSKVRWTVMLSVSLACAVSLSLAVGPVAALDPSSTDAAAIFRAVLNAQGGASTASRMKMSIRDSAGTRERILNVRGKRYEATRKTLIQIEQPSEVRNTGFLTIAYLSQGHTDEQWLYLPALRRVSRVPSSGKADSFVGSDFSISDLSPQDPENYNVTMVQPSVKIGDEECWMLETTPRTKKVREETGYDKSQVWVSKQKLATVQLKSWVSGTKKTKYFKASDIRNVNGVWTAYRMQMRTLDGSNVASETSIEVLKMDNDAKDVVDSDFTQQRLEQGV